jgi:hypothetical protein
VVLVAIVLIACANVANAAGPRQRGGLAVRLALAPGVSHPRHSWSAWCSLAGGLLGDVRTLEQPPAGRHAATGTDSAGLQVGRIRVLGFTLAVS